MNSDDFKIHAVIVKKNIDFYEAQKIAKDIINNPKRNFYRETGSSWRFRNIAKTKFEPKSYRTKKINPNVSIIFGKLKN
jgi:hypothetical protein